MVGACSRRNKMTTWRSASKCDNEPKMNTKEKEKMGAKRENENDEKKRKT